MDNYITWQVEHYPTLPSTNDYCIEQARLDNRSNLAVLADSQTTPRGSRGRQWVEPTGNLALSFLYWPSFSIKKVHWVPFVASLALYDAVINLCGNQHELCIKWPNDLLFNNKKIAGILIESHIEYPCHLKWLVLGFGVNIFSAPLLSDRVVGCLKDFIVDPPTPKQLAEHVGVSLSYWLQCLSSEKESLIRDEWSKRSIKIGTPLVVTIANNQYQGVYNGIDEKGFLLLKTPTKMEHISAGEVFYLDKYKEK
ncbi:biotin--[acetyl-CoA-carboxylase] ligase [Commensalibacter oyaizuii]|uniref:biotin--[biotin carboxyl-carrier protein] ligase n=1 Tax=Commensalibacter oyaizuii TaxID=3043873 RepID=A0ABT6Q0U8_9PROT|nr:biotin--[acetyl-CoA-carboxylase] ligase [Commensalibacter sp. TBRC 16381]MDI2090371.1 biotin--[acetyl-CoA-carboxylase] ligase [Commensalibacter sp. TBRC 16381]